MPMTAMPGLLQRMREVVLLGHGLDASDAELLTAYLAERAESAFCAIVRRHGAMVLGVCRRVLGDRHDAEDAFQATFLVLVRKAAAIVPRDSLAGWLHGVAHRTALKAKAMKARRHAKEQRAATGIATVDDEPSCGLELRRILDRELAALPDCFRLPVILCDLEGKSRKEAARQLGCGAGTLSGRLARGRRKLAQRLTRSGITLGAGGVAACLSQQALAAGPSAPLVSATVKAGTLFLAGSLHGASAPAADLAREVLQAMFISKLKSMAAGIAMLALGLVLAVGALGAFAADEPQAAAQVRKTPPKDQQQPDEKALAGKIYFHRGLDLTIFDPRLKNFSELPALGETERFNYQALSARLSPDGRYLAYGRVEMNRGTPPDKIRLRAMGKDDEPTVLVSMPDKELSNWVWSPDGKKLTFAVWDEGEGQYQPWMVDVATKETERIKLPKLPSKIEKDYGALVHAWSPDGLWVVHSKGHFHLMDPKTKETRKLNEEATGFFMGSVRVSPDGKKMLYLSATVERDWSLCVLDLLLGKTTVVAKMANTAEMSAAWSPDSRNIVCGHAAANAEGRADGDFHVEIFTLGDNRRRTLLKAAEWLTVTDWR